MKRLLIIGYVWPEPASSAAGSRMLQLIRLFLADGWDVTFASAAAPSVHAVDIESLGVHKVQVALNHHSFDQFVGQLRPDMVMFDRFMIEEQFGWRVAQQCPKALRLLDTEDLHCLRAARQQAHKSGTPVGVAELNSELAMREVASILRCDLSLIISAYEVGLLQTHYGVDPSLLWHLPFMLAPVAEADFPGFGARSGYISIGNFRHAPNWDAVLALKHTVWPAIRGLQADARLSVYGAYPSPKAMQLHDPGEGFLVHGWADDARAVMTCARVCLAPLRFGAGLKGKLVEAMACGTPSVTTSIGAEAMHDGLPWSGEVVDDLKVFAERAVALYHDPQAWQRAQCRGVDILRTHYDAAQLGSSLLVRISELRASLVVHRQHNFIGAMLQHHSLQSTRYMAQWIEAKNRNRDSVATSSDGAAEDLSA
ncbi:MAG: glycosyltransferase family 4 protein [Gammaproteobacteria bacterium]|nr:glycosyltransferase family 4 protein [Gammaproteobacteria bacterium]